MGDSALVTWYFPTKPGPSLARTNWKNNMEDIEKKEEEKEEEQEDAGTEDTPPEDQKKPDESDEDPEGVYYEKELAKKEGEKKPKDEAEKARRALFFNAKRAEELGVDPAEVLGIKPKTEEGSDVNLVVKRHFDERDARSLSKSESEFKLIMWYVDNKGLSVEEAHLLANKGKIQRSAIEARRSVVEFGKPSFGGRKNDITDVPEHPGKDILERRGYKFNPKTKTYQATLYEEYFDQEEKVWKSRKISR